MLGVAGGGRVFVVEYEGINCFHIFPSVESSGK